MIERIEKDTWILIFLTGVMIISLIAGELTHYVKTRIRNKENKNE